MSKFIVGLTGGIGSGKTTVSNMFADLGVDIIDADVVAREVVEPNSYALNKITQHFGSEMLLADGRLNRKLLREKVFTSDVEKQWLNQLLHPLIREQLILQLKQASSEYCILSAPLLFENNLQKLVNTSLVVDVEETTQINRTCRRDDVNEAQIKAIMGNQINRSKRLALANDIIANESVDLSQLKNQVLILHKKYHAMTLKQVSQ